METFGRRNSSSYAKIVSNEFPGRFRPVYNTKHNEGMESYTGDK